MWKAKSLIFADLLATSTATEHSLLLGPQEWTVYNDSCSNERSYTLMMTGCHEDEFTCSDATCVSMAVRCDGRTDCQDGTDEADCKVFVTSLGYNKYLVPPTDDNGKLKINISFDLHEIIEVNEIENFFRVKYNLQRTWSDTRLTYYNLKYNAFDNKISSENRGSIWTSWLTFDNIESKEKMKRTDDADQMIIVSQNLSDFNYADDTYLHNTRLFHGSTNAIRHSKQYSIDWLCDFNMAWYPFDTQSCTMEIINKYRSVEFELGNLAYLGPTDLPQHFVDHVNMCVKNNNDDQRIIVEVVFGRPIFASFLTTTLPTVMLIIISQMATSFSKEYLDMVIQVNLTVLLVLATL